MYKVFINDNPLFFAQKRAQLSLFQDIKFYNFESSSEFYNKIISLQKVNQICILSNQPKEALKGFFKDYRFILAAGGVVHNDNDQLLFIYRNQFWDLPKGKVEENENERSAAVREVEEECGIIGPVIMDKLPSTFHTYTQKNTKYLKKTSWFRMQYHKNHDLVPQLEEGITKVEWIDKSNLNPFLKNTFASIQYLIKDLAY